MNKLDKLTIEERFLLKYAQDVDGDFLGIEEIFGTKLKFGDNINRRISRMLGLKKRCSNEEWTTYLNSVTDTVIAFTPTTFLNLVSVLNIYNEDVYIHGQKLIFMDKDSVSKTLIPGLQYYNSNYSMDKETIVSIKSVLEKISPDLELKKEEQDIINKSRQIVESYYNNKLNVIERRIDITKRDLQYLEKKKEMFESEKKKIKLI